MSVVPAADILRHFTIGPGGRRHAGLSPDAAPQPALSLLAG
jgi:hypothetical protein